MFDLKYVNTKEINNSLIKKVVFTLVITILFFKIYVIIRINIWYWAIVFFIEIFLILQSGLKLDKLANLKSKLCKERAKTDKKVKCPVCLEEYDCIKEYEKFRCVTCGYEVYAVKNEKFGCEKRSDKLKDKYIYKIPCETKPDIEELYTELLCLYKNYLIFPEHLEEFINKVASSAPEELEPYKPLIFNVCRMLEYLRKYDSDEWEEPLKKLEQLIPEQND